MKESLSQKSALARRTGVVLATGFLTATFILLYACRSRSPAGSAADAQDAVGYAVRFVATVPADDDVWVREQGKVLEKAVQVCIRRHEADRALLIAGTIPSWHRGSAYADLAVAFAQEGRLQTATNLLRKAEEWQTVMKDRYESGTLGWCVGRIGGHIAAARTAMGMTGSRGVVGAATQSAGYVATFGPAVATLTNADIHRIFSVVESLGTMKNPEIQAMYSDGVLNWSERSNAITTNDLLRVAEAVHRAMIMQPLSSGITMRCRLAALWWRHGVLARANEEVNEAERLAEKLPEGYLRAVALGEIAATLFAWMPGSCAPLLERAVVEAGRGGGSDRLQAYSRLAVFAARMNDNHRAEALIGLAVDDAEALPVAQARLLRLAEVSLGMAETWTGLPEPLVRRLEAVMVRERASTAGPQGKL